MLNILKETWLNSRLKILRDMQYLEISVQILFFSKKTFKILNYAFFFYTASKKQPYSYQIQHKINCYNHVIEMDIHKTLGKTSVLPFCEKTVAHACKSVLSWVRQQRQTVVRFSLFFFKTKSSKSKQGQLHAWVCAAVHLWLCHVALVHRALTSV